MRTTNHECRIHIPDGSRIGVTDGIATPMHESAKLSALGTHGTCLHELDPNAFCEFPDIVIETNNRDTPIEDFEEIM
jgi:hypothetical protein